MRIREGKKIAKKDRLPRVRRAHGREIICFGNMRKKDQEGKREKTNLASCASSPEGRKAPRGKFEAQPPGNISRKKEKDSRLYGGERIRHRERKGKRTAGWNLRDQDQTKTHLQDDRERAPGKSIPFFQKKRRRSEIQGMQGRQRDRGRTPSR